MKSRTGIICLIICFVVMLIACVPQNIQLKGTWAFVDYKAERIKSIIEPDSTICFDGDGNGYYYLNNDPSIFHSFTYLISKDHKLAIIIDEKASVVEYSIDSKNKRLALDGLEYRLISSEVEQINYSSMPTLMSTPSPKPTEESTAKSTPTPTPSPTPEHKPTFTATPVSSPTSVSTENEQSYVNDLSGEWKQINIAGWRTYSYDLVNTANDCVRFILNYTMTHSSYSWGGNCIVYVHHLNEGWVQIGAITLSKEDISNQRTIRKEFVFDQPVSFDKLLVVPSFEATFSCYLSITDAQFFGTQTATSTTSTIGVPETKPSASPAIVTSVYIATAAPITPAPDIPTERRIVWTEWSENGTIPDGCIETQVKREYRYQYIADYGAFVEEPSGWVAVDPAIVTVEQWNEETQQYETVEVAGVYCVRLEWSDWTESPDWNGNQKLYSSDARTMYRYAYYAD